MKVGNETMNNEQEIQYDVLKLENQLCFPLYVCSKEIIKKYKPFLDELDLTYTQYIALMVLWEQREINVKTLGEYLFLDSGTLTPVLKKLETKGYITRIRAKEDERILIIQITESGMKLRENALKVPQKVAKCVNLNEEDAKILYKLLHKMMDSV
ncbi:MAG: MarR family winged helix-turn-helix transcriptional regulator [Lachnospiraceae bacterium]